MATSSPPASQWDAVTMGLCKCPTNIRAIIRNSPSARTTLLESSTGAIEEAFALMKESDWVHFACHGIQDVASRTESGLCLADRRRLKISDIIALSRPHGGLAFLSKCPATGEERRSILQQECCLWVTGSHWYDVVYQR